MYHAASVLVCLACTGYGQQVPTISAHLPRNSVAHRLHLQEAKDAGPNSQASVTAKQFIAQPALSMLVKFLLAFNHVDVFRLSRPTSLHPQRTPSLAGFHQILLDGRSHSNPVPVMSVSDRGMISKKLVTGKNSQQVRDSKGSLPSFSRRTLLAGAGAAAASSLLPVLPVLAAEQNIYQVPASVADKRILITGANTGLGLESGKRLAEAGAKVVLTARTQAKADAALAAVKEVAPRADVKALVLDLGNLESIRNFPAKYDAAVGAPLDVLMANAGVMAIPERLTTADGFERQLGVNHLGHFALVAGMMPALRKAVNGFRIISVSSEAHRFATVDSMKDALASDLDPKNYQQWGNYGLSKAANVLFAKELQRRFDAAGVRGSAVSLHPGGVATDLGRYLVQGVEAAEAGVPLLETYEAMNPIQKWLAKSLQSVILTVPVGANTQLFLAAAADSNGDLTKDGGRYFDNMKAAKPAEWTNSKELAAQLFELSEKLTGAKIEI